MATKDKKLARKSSKKSREENFQIEIHFGSFQEEALSDALDILASMLCEYLKESKHHEK